LCRPVSGTSCGDNDAWVFTICKDAGNSGRLLVNADGRFDHVDINGASPAGRAFIYQSCSGDLLYVRTHFLISEHGNAPLRCPVQQK
jgi:hypothetical protein